MATMIDDVDNGVDDNNDVDDGVENGDDNGADNCDDDSVGDGNDSDDKHLTHLSQAAHCSLMERSKQDKHVVCNKEYNFDDGVDIDTGNGDDDSVKDGDYDGIVDGDESADKHLTHLSQAVGCCLTER
eukprot:15268224-Ditylum_brightwellii.AAC.1